MSLHPGDRLRPQMGGRRMPELAHAARGPCGLLGLDGGR
jgi:hypothetical protein